ncbi:MAG: leucine-rich repeat domain-containing protein [Candidatus Thorarchaeota archaeon]
MTNRNIRFTYRVQDSIDDIEVVYPHHDDTSNTIKQLIASKKLASELVTIKLNQSRIQSLNLDFLEGCEQLKQLELHENQLENLDLSNLKYTPRLETLDLSRNRIELLDLTPLTLCRNIQTVNLLANPLRNINLVPLLFCDRLGHLMIPNDISRGPVSSTSRKESLQSQAVREIWNHILTWTPPPWVKLLGPEFQVRRTDYDNIIDMLGWDTVKDLLRKYTHRLAEESWYPIQAKTLEALGMGELACYDGHPIHIIDCIPTEIDYDNARHALFQNIVDLLREHLQKGGSTFCFNIERMEKTKASILIPDVVERRKQEMSEVVVRVYGNKVNLSQLHKSHYGREMMRALSLDVVTDHGGLDRLQKRLRLAGIELNIEVRH